MEPVESEEVSYVLFRAFIECDLFSTEPFRQFNGRAACIDNCCKSKSSYGKVNEFSIHTCSLIVSKI